MVVWPCLVIRKRACAYNHASKNVLPRKAARINVENELKIVLRVDVSVGSVYEVKNARECVCRERRER